MLAKCLTVLFLLYITAVIIGGIFVARGNLHLELSYRGRPLPLWLGVMFFPVGAVVMAVKSLTGRDEDNYDITP